MAARSSDLEVTASRQAANAAADWKSRQAPRAVRFYQRGTGIAAIRPHNRRGQSAVEPDGERARRRVCDPFKWSSVSHGGLPRGARPLFCWGGRTPERWIAWGGKARPRRRV